MKKFEALRGVHPTPWNGFIRSMLPRWTGAFPMVDLASGTVPLTAMVPGSNLYLSDHVPRPMEEPIYLPLLSQNEGEQGHRLRLEETNGPWGWRGVDVVVHVRTLDLPTLGGLLKAIAKDLHGATGSFRLVLDPLSFMAGGSLDERAEKLIDLLAGGVPKNVQASLLVPLVGGICSTEDVQVMVEIAQRVGLSSVVPIEVETTPKALRAIAEYAETSGLPMEEGRLMRLYHSDALTRKRGCEVVARTELPWWLELHSSDPASRCSRSRFVASQLALVAELGAWLDLGTGFVEGHLQAARRIGSLPHDVGVMILEGHLKLLDWLDRRVQSTLLEWFAADERVLEPAPVLTRLRDQFVANSSGREVALPWSKDTSFPGHEQR